MGNTTNNRSRKYVKLVAILYQCKDCSYERSAAARTNMFLVR